jgi:hypothetical protein
VDRDVLGSGEMHGVIDGWIIVQPALGGHHDRAGLRRSIGRPGERLGHLDHGRPPVVAVI